MADLITYDDFAKLELRVAKVARGQTPSERRQAHAPCRWTWATSRSRSWPGFAALHARATRRKAIVDREQSGAGDAPRRDLKRHAPGGHLGRKGHRPHPDDPECEPGQGQVSKQPMPREAECVNRNATIGPRARGPRRFPDARGTLVDAVLQTLGAIGRPVGPRPRADLRTWHVSPGPARARSTPAS